MNWPAIFWKPARAQVEKTLVALNAACPGCGHLDTVIIRPIWRHDISGMGVIKREVGSHVRCARCVREFMIGLQGVYEPRPEKPEIQPEERAKIERERARMSGYSDIPWNRG